MSEMHDRLRLAREMAGYPSTADAARAMGMRISTYAAHENGQNKFKADKAGEYGRKFGVKAAWLLMGDPTDAPDQSFAAVHAPVDIALPAQMPPANASPPVPVQYPTARLPMLGTAVGGEDGRFVLNGNQIGDALCPPQLLGVPNAYGVFVNGTSMEPRYHPGEAVFVNPHLPVRSGDYVVVQVAGAFDGDDLAGYVKRFISMNATELVLEQYQDRDPTEAGALPGDNRTIRIARQRVVAVHKIVASGIA